MSENKIVSVWVEINNSPDHFTEIMDMGNVFLVKVTGWNSDTDTHKDFTTTSICRDDIDERIIHHYERMAKLPN